MAIPLSETCPMIWIDADACPRPVREVLINAARRQRCELTFVSQQPLQLPALAAIRRVQVEAGFDAADSYIAERAQPGDLVITQDLPLAAECLARGAAVVNPHGEVLDEENIRERLRVRAVLAEMRDAGQFSGGRSAMAAPDKARFANVLDRWLTRGRC
ncbi:MAG: YaiI/YqxD family protein [Spongiibacteraceae bacterium]|nr:YaiI/YqxD family protein [Spongiibacteraceae bacterium]